MYALTDSFRSALAYPSDQPSVARVEVWRGSTQLSSGLSVVGGKVSVDSSGNVWRHADVTVVDPDNLVAPLSGSSVLAPFGNELRIYRGLQIAGVAVTLPLGVFRISSAVIEDRGGRTVALTAYDRSWTVARSRLEAPYVIPAGTNYATAMAALLTTVYPSCPYAFATTTATTPLIVLKEMDDPWKALDDMAMALGNQLYFDVTGTCVMRAQPNPSTDTPVWTYGDGTATSIANLKVQYNADPGYNEFIVEGNPPGLPPVRSVAQDLDVTSPTYYGGPYGKVPEFYSSTFVTTQAQADAAALAGLLRNKGGTQELSFSAIANPAHEGLDVVRVTRARDGLDSIFVMESFDIPLDPELMSVKCRKRSTL